MTNFLKTSGQSFLEKIVASSEELAEKTRPITRLLKDVAVSSIPGMVVVKHKQISQLEELKEHIHRYSQEHNVPTQLQIKYHPGDKGIDNFMAWSFELFSVGIPFTTVFLDYFNSPYSNGALFISGVYLAMRTLVYRLGRKDISEHGIHIEEARKQLPSAVGEQGCWTVYDETQEQGKLSLPREEGAISVLEDAVNINYD